MSEGGSPGSFARALAEQKRRIRHRRLWVGGIVGGVVLLVGFTLYALFFSPWFVVKQVSVEAGPLLTTERIQEAAAVRMGEPLVRVDLTAIDARVSDLIEVAGVAVRREFPDTVHITVTEREAVYERDTGTGFQWIDADGIAFHTADTRDGSRLVASVAEDDVRLLRDIATVVHWIPADVRLDVEGIEATAVDSIVLHLTDSREVIWGSAEDSQLKAEVLGTLLQVEAEVYDISAPMYPTTR